eukprot:1075337-Pyramimonas_sp.AAC.1
MEECVCVSVWVHLTTCYSLRDNAAPILPHESFVSAPPRPNRPPNLLQLLLRVCPLLANLLTTCQPHVQPHVVNKCEPHFNHILEHGDVHKKPYDDTSGLVGLAYPGHCEGLPAGNLDPLGTVGARA